MIHRTSYIFYRFGNEPILPKKHAAEIEVFEN